MIRITGYENLDSGETLVRIEQASDPIPTTPPRVYACSLVEVDDPLFAEEIIDAMVTELGAIKSRDGHSCLIPA